MAGNQNSAVRKNPFGGDDAPPAVQKAPERKAPASDSILKALETKLAEPKQKESLDVKKRQILERCGCL